MATVEAPQVARDDGRARFRLSSLLPALGWLRGYQRRWLRADLLAAITLAAYLLPAGIGDASLANLPPEAGLYACIFPGLVFWLFCSSRRTSITVTSAISLLIGSSIGSLAGGDAPRFYALASCTALLVGALAFLAWIVRAGALTSFISESVLVGFKAGVALYLASTQLPKLFGFTGAHGDFWERSGHFLTHLGETVPAALLLGVAALGVLLLGKRFLKNKPVALLVVIAGIAATSLAGLEAHGVHTLGELPRGIPWPALPSVSLSDLDELLPLAAACFLLGAVETVAIGRMFAVKTHARLDANQELLALSAANLAAGFGHGYPVSGGMSQSLVNDGGGAKSPLSTLFAALIVLAATLFLSDLLRDLPQPVLAAIVLTAVLGLFQPAAFRHLWRVNRYEFVVALSATIGVLGSGLLRGVLIGVVISLFQIIRRAARPHVALLGRIPGSRRFSDHERHPDNELVPGVLIFRPEASVLYFNAEDVREQMLDFVRDAPEPTHTVICDLSASPQVDITAARTFSELSDELGHAGINLRLVEARSSVRDLLRLEGLDDKVGTINRFETVADAVDDAVANAPRAS